MKAGVIKFSEVGNRLDADFHLFRKEWEDQANALRDSIPEDDREKFESDVAAKFGDPDLFSMDMLRVIEPLLRGSFAGRRGREDFVKAAKEYPYLAVVAVSSESDRLMRARREALEKQASNLANVQSGWKSLIATATESLEEMPTLSRP